MSDPSTLVGDCDGAVRKALVTGGAGFIGSHLARRLLNESYAVTVLDDLSTGRLENIVDLQEESQFRFVEGSVVDADLVARLVDDVDLVFHLASAVGVGLIMQQPVRSIETIVGGTQSVLNACSQRQRPVLITSSSEVYGKGSAVPFCEADDVLTGATSKQRWAYACAKSLDEFLALAHWHESQTPVYIARLFNTVGPGQIGKYGMVLPRFVAAALRDEPLIIHGDGEQSRCFAHIDDIVVGLTTLIGVAECCGEVINLGSDEEITLNQLAERVIALTNSRSEIKHISYAEAYGAGFEDMRRRVPSLQKAKRLLNYVPRHNLDDILRAIIATPPTTASG